MYTLKKSLGQHFLEDQNIIDKIIDSISRDHLKQLVEIGPGGGALTQHLIQWKDIDFKAIEVDDDKVKYLLHRWPAMETKLIHEDVLKTNTPFEGQFSVVGNFPYNISSSILFRILEWEPQVDETVGMFQKEVAQRIASKHGNKNYGILSVLIQAFFSVEYLFDVPQQCFNPPPKVMSGVIRLKNLKNPHEIENKKGFIKMVKAAFSQRRKTLRNALKSFYPMEILQADIFNKRAEQLSVAEMVCLYKEVLK